MKKKSILDMLEQEETHETVEEVVKDETVVVMSPDSTKRQTYCMTYRNIELLRHVAFQTQMNKQDIVNHAVTKYIQDNYPEIFERVKNY